MERGAAAPLFFYLISAIVLIAFWSDAMSLSRRSRIAGLNSFALARLRLWMPWLTSAVSVFALMSMRMAMVVVPFMEG